MTQEKAIIEIAQERGSDAVDVRDAAHEMCHGLAADTDDWSRNGIHEALCEKYQRSDLLRAEVIARAVERTVCEHFGIKYDAENWLHIAAMETMRIFSNIPDNFWPNAVDMAMTSQECAETVERILILGEERAS